jgi:hypothetical protein
MLLALATTQNVLPPATTASHAPDAGNAICVHTVPSGDVAANVPPEATAKKIVPFHAIADQDTCGSVEVNAIFIPSGDVTVTGLLDLKTLRHTIEKMVPFHAMAANAVCLNGIVASACDLVVHVVPFVDVAQVTVVVGATNP